MSIKINIGSLKQGGQQIDLEVLPSELGLGESSGTEISGPVKVIMELFKSDHQLDINVIISGKLSLECDRCLDFFGKEFRQKLELVYVQKSPREDEYNDDYMRTYNPHMKTIDITNDIKEMIVLAVPMRRVPPEKEDGSCSWCGKSKEYWHQFISEENED